MKVLWPREDEDTSKWKLLYQDSIVVIYEKGQRLLAVGVVRKKYFGIFLNKEQAEWFCQTYGGVEK